MDRDQKHVLNVVDYRATEHNTVFVKVTGYDAILEKEFVGDVKFVSGIPYGDLVHLQRSSLSSGCIEFVRENLVKRYAAGDFD